MINNKLYQAILARESVRRYDRRPLAAAALERVGAIAEDARPLDPQVPVQTLWRDVAASESLSAILGPYGRIVTPPHYVVPYAKGGPEALVELGYRAEQIVVRLAAEGIGSCYLGCLPRENEVRDHLGLPEGTRIAASLVYGRSAKGWGGRAINAAMHRVTGAANKLAVERFFYSESFDAPSLAPAELAPLLQAARAAPSAINAQPWRLLWRDGVLTLFVQRQNSRYGSGPSAAYRYHDGGICMANISLALEAQGEGDACWETLLGEGPEVPPHPEELEPLARIALS